MPDHPQVDICAIEDVLGKYFGEAHVVYNGGGDAYHIQDLGPELADFLHKLGVDVDWSDRSRYRKETHA